MLNYVITFFLLAVLAAIFGFGGLAGAFAEIAKMIALICIALFVATLVASAISGKRPPAI
jgi:uncharacterized membrane protein YtjA (UPF0391 family)